MKSVKKSESKQPSDRIENISQDFTLCIATHYGRITINNIWYRYDSTTDSLIRESAMPPLSLFEEPEHYEDDIEPF